MINKLSTIIQGGKYKYVVDLHMKTDENVMAIVPFGCDTMDDVIKCIRENYRNGDWIYIQEKKNDNNRTKRTSL